MKQLSLKAEQLYKKICKPLELCVFPLILLLWPLIKVMQGVDVSDSTYSLGNYLFADRLDGVWVISTYLSNFVGSLMVRLPGGDTLLGANIYSGLIVSLIALLCYFVLRGDFTSPVLFAGEFIAINFCWIPTGILYNYLTYLFFTIGALLIFKAVKKESDRYLGLAGIALGVNVFVRIPNLTEAALIIAVWMAVVIDNKKSGAKENIWPVLLKKTGICLAGYLIGVLIPLCIVIANYGIIGITDMIAGLGAISQSSEGYSLSGMIMATVSAYVRSAKWVFIVLAVVFSGTLLIAAVKKNGLLKHFGRVLYVVIVAVMLRFFWGRGMFSFRYYEDYTSMFEWGMMTLYMSWICAITVLVRKNYNILMKTYAAITLVMLVITPLGSNNYTCQNLNNLFVIMPFLVFVIGGWLYRGIHRIRLMGIMYGCNFPWMSMLIIIAFVVLVQSSLFHTSFVFRDGMDGTKRDTVIGADDDDKSLYAIRGMHTGSKNAEALTGLCKYIGASESSIESAIYWGDCPGLSFVLGVPSAIGTTWPDLDSYPTDTFDMDLVNLSLSEDADDSIVIWHKIESPSGNNAAMKQDILADYIASRKLQAVYENEEYIVYQ